MSHEIRTPMNTILGMTELSLLKKLDDDLRENLINVKESSNHLLDIINDILDISKIEAGKIELEIIDFDIIELIQSIIRTFQVQAQKHNIYLKLETAESTPAYIKGDPVRLRQVLVNLIGNAVKFTQEGGVTVNITGTKQLSKKIKFFISVIDTGIGIPKNKLQSIFENFSQASKSTTRKYGGSGLGLSISKKLVELMGGSIQAESELEKGSCFFVTISFDPGNEQIIKDKQSTQKTTEAEKSESLKIDDLRKKNVLVVDDNPSNIKVAEKFLNKFGYSSFSANNVKNALEIISLVKIDIILMDIEMPEMDGLELTKLIRNGKFENVNSNIPIVAMTAHAFSSYQKKCFDSGMNDYITKPINFQELKLIIERVLSTKSENHFLSIAQKKSHKKILKVINRKDALLKIDGDEDFYNKMISDFFDNINIKLEEIRKAIDNIDFKEIRLHSHSLKSLSGIIGAEYIFDICLNIETKAINKCHESMDELFDNLKVEVEKVKSETNKVLNNK